MPGQYLGEPRLKKLLASGKTQLGLWTVCRDPFFLELAAHSGCDVLLVEAEHSSLTLTDIERVAMIARSSPANIMVRMPGIDQALIKQVLDLGIEGMVVPFVNTREDAQELASYGMYPPRGIRGIAPRRAQHLVGGAWEYQRVANDDIVVLVPQIEHIDAVGNLDEICSVEGIGGLFLGPSDLSLSMGLGGEYEHPDVVAAKRKVFDASRRHGLPFACASSSAENARYWIDQGAELVMVGADYGLFSAGVEGAVEEFRRLVG